jgi:hypothetical protein
MKQRLISCLEIQRSTSVQNTRENSSNEAECLLADNQTTPCVRDWSFILIVSLVHDYVSEIFRLG